MKLFLCVMALTFGLIFGAAWFWTANDFIKFADSDYATWIAKKLMLDDCNVGAVAIVGDSQAQASIVPKKVGPNVVNFGLIGGSPVSMLAVSRRIVACPELPKAIILSLSFEQFMGIDMFWKREVRYGVFDMDLEELRRSARKTGDTLLYDPPTPFDFDMRLKGLLMQAKFPSYYFGSMLAGYFYRREETNMGFLHDTLKDKGYHFFGETIGDNRVRLKAYRKSYTSAPFFEIYFARMLDLYAAHNIPVYYIDAPVKTTALQVMSPEFKDGFVNYIHHWEGLYPNFHILGGLLPSLPPEDFTDANHVNVLGAVIWSNHVAALLKAAGVDTGSPFSFD